MIDGDDVKYHVRVLAPEVATAAADGASAVLAGLSNTAWRLAVNLGVLSTMLTHWVDKRTPGFTTLYSGTSTEWRDVGPEGIRL